MTDELNPETTPETEAAPEAEQGQEVLGGDDTEEGDQSEQPEGQAATDDDSEEVEHEGKKFRIPKELKSALMMQADYTRKTQEVAEMRRAVEEERGRITQANQEQIHGLARIVSMDEQIDAFSKVDWQNLTAQDPIQAQQAWMQYSQLKENRNALAGQLQQQAQNRAVESQQLSAKRIDEARTALQASIPGGWNQQIEDEAVNFGIKELGLQPQELVGAFDKRLGAALHYARIGKQFLDSQQKAMTKKPATAQATTVPTTVGKKPPAQLRYSPDMSDADYAKWRRQQKAKR